MKKITKTQKFEMLKAIPAVAENPILAEFIEHELELLAKKNSTEKKPTAKQTENASIQTAILDYLCEEPERKCTITELMKAVPECAELTNQRVAAIVRPLIGESIERVVEKRVAYFKAK